MIHSDPIAFKKTDSADQLGIFLTVFSHIVGKDIAGYQGYTGNVSALQGSK